MAALAPTELHVMKTEQAAAAPETIVLAAEAAPLGGGVSVQVPPQLTPETPDTKLTVLLTGDGPSIRRLLARFPAPTDVTVGEHVVMKFVRLKPVDEVCLRANSVLFEHVDVVVVVESVMKLLGCTIHNNKRSGSPMRKLDAAYAPKGNIGGLTSQRFVGSGASHLAKESGAAFMLVASEAHLRGLPHLPEMGETTREEFEATAESLGGKYMELSESTGEGVDSFLDTAARLGLQSWRKRKVQSQLRQLRGKRLESQSRRSIGSHSSSRLGSSESSESIREPAFANVRSNIESMLCLRDFVFGFGPKTKAARKPQSRNS